MRLLLFLCLFIGFGCTQDEAERPMPSSSPGTDIPASGSTYLALGDSYTIGQGVAEADRWSRQLAQAAGLASPVIIARTGWTTSELQRAIEAANIQKTYDLVSLMIGVNNQFRGQPQATYRTEFRQLLGTATGLAGNRPGRVFVLSIPDWGRSPFGQSYDQAQISREIDQFNAVARDECQQAGVVFVDVTSATRAAAGDATQFAPDGLHYSGRQMQLWVQQALPVVRTALK
ncbi:SGNH/GDSL hydrolase family protein [Hymenobacter cellulosivorans]|uniref:SGNH/GDSL hydrolase family protein n=1 Tax=Hymenobacter cellulosivorans TaxID=2932249 RepID=A0ABY4FAS2_9BACT|nr:SGNH/GDSL hydrolase family protein [Hymenobacter cellulosivorans]UOQ53024.1 SGNH/GDSL hydrolase family protein [Hymenobacter cellulosivorans]